MFNYILYDAIYMTWVTWADRTSLRNPVPVLASAARPAASRCRSGMFARSVPMAKKSEEGVYRIVDVVGVSETSWEDAGRQAVKTASKSLRDLRIAEVVKMDMKVEDGKVVAFRTRVALSFKYES